MMRALFVLLVSLLTVSIASAEAGLCESTSSPTTQRTFFEQAMSKIEAKSGQNLNINESKYFAHHMTTALKLHAYTTIAIHQAQILCRPKWIDPVTENKDTNDNELDAVRHFVLATLLSYFFPDEAMTILTKHEITGETPLDAANLMDLYNNQMGIRFGEGLLKSKKKMSKSDVAFAAVERALTMLNHNELRVLKPIQYGPCQGLTTKTPTEIKKIFADHRAGYDKFEASCFDKPPNCGVQGVIGK
jgi:hypothetical protein